MNYKELLWSIIASCMVGFFIDIKQYGIASAIFSFVVFIALTAILYAIVFKK